VRKGYWLATLQAVDVSALPKLKVLCVSAATVRVSSSNEAVISYGVILDVDISPTRKFWVVDLHLLPIAGLGPFLVGPSRCWKASHLCVCDVPIPYLSAPSSSFSTRHRSSLLDRFPLAYAEFVDASQNRFRFVGGEVDEVTSLGLLRSHYRPKRWRFTQSRLLLCLKHTRRMKMTRIKKNGNGRAPLSQMNPAAKQLGSYCSFCTVGSARWPYVV
jgi:hypothetical protein